jgi:hypothetical protein
MKASQTLIKAKPPPPALSHIFVILQFCPPKVRFLPFFENSIFGNLRNDLDFAFRNLLESLANQGLSG